MADVLMADVLMADVLMADVLERKHSEVSSEEDVSR